MQLLVKIYGLTYIIIKNINARYYINISGIISISQAELGVPSYFVNKLRNICDCPWENRPSSHLVIIVEIPI